MDLDLDLDLDIDLDFNISEEDEVWTLIWHGSRSLIIQFFFSNGDPDFVGWD